MEKESELRLNVGDPLQLQFVGHDERKFAARVIGYLPGGSVIISTPRVDGKVMLVREGQPLVVRMMSGRNCYAFNSQIVHSALRPYPHLHLAYPSELEKIVVRKAVRVRARLPVSLSHPVPGDPSRMQDSRAVIEDISTAGALVSSDRPIAAAEDLLVITARVPVAGVEKYMKLNALVRSVREQHDEAGEIVAWHYGVEFQMIEEMDAILLHGYVYEQMQQ